MQSIVLYEPGQLRRREAEEPLLPGPGEVLIRIQRIISYMEHGQIQSAPWITHRSNFADLNDAFPLWLKRDSGVIKAMITL